MAHEQFLPHLPQHLQDAVWVLDGDSLGLHGGLRSGHVSDFHPVSGRHRKPAGEPLPAEP